MRSSQCQEVILLQYVPLLTMHAAFGAWKIMFYTCTSHHYMSKLWQALISILDHSSSHQYCQWASECPMMVPNVWVRRGQLPSKQKYVFKTSWKCLCKFAKYFDKTSIIRIFVNSRKCFDETFWWNVLVKMFYKCFLDVF